MTVEQEELSRPSMRCQHLKLHLLTLSQKYPQEPHEPEAREEQGDYPVDQLLSEQHQVDHPQIRWQL